MSPDCLSLPAVARNVSLLGPSWGLGLVQALAESPTDVKGFIRSVIAAITFTPIPILKLRASWYMVQYIG
jgi:hypothetical protein